MFSGVLPPRLAGKGAIFAAMPFTSNSVRFVLGFVFLMTLGNRASSQEEAMPFQLDIALEPASEGEWNLILDLDMDPGDWVVSSYSTDSMFGRVALRFQEPEALTLSGAMEEIPPSQWEVEPLCTPFETTFTLTQTSEGGWEVVHTGSRDAFPPGHKLRH